MRTAAMPDLLLRPATAGDLAAINAIYNHYVLASTCTYQTEPETEAARAAWFAAHGPAHPIRVAERSGAIVGWGSLSRFRERAAYGRTVENSIYVHPEHHRQGVGAALLAEQIESAAALGHQTIIAGIDAEQAASVGLHARFGFTQAGYLARVGFKFGRWLDVIYMQRMLPPTISASEVAR
jgi:L-amino acid N-acyltransferase YncA